MSNSRQSILNEREIFIHGLASMVLSQIPDNEKNHKKKMNFMIATIDLLMAEDAKQEGGSTNA